MKSEKLQKFYNEWKDWMRSTRCEGTYRIVTWQVSLFLRWCETHKVNIVPSRRELERYSLDISVGKSPNTAKLYLGAVAAFYRWMWKMGYIRHNNAYRLGEDISTRRHTPKVMTNDEYLKLQEWLHKNRKRFAWQGYVITAAWNTGMRLSDICKLKWTNVDLDNGVITFVPWKTRNIKPEPVSIPITQEFADYLRDYQLRHNMVGSCCSICPGLRGMYESRWSELNLAPIFQACGINKTLRSMRHAFVSRCVERGVHPSVIAELTGQSVAIIQRYTHVPMDVKVKAIRAVMGPRVIDPMSTIK